MDASQALGFKNLTESIIKKYSLVLGPHIVLERVDAVGGILLDSHGAVLEFKSDPNKLLTNLIKNLVELSPNVASKILFSLLPAESGFLSTAKAVYDKNTNESQKHEFIGEHGDLQLIVGGEQTTAQSDVSEKSPQQTDVSVPSESVSQPLTDQDTAIANLDTAKIDEVNRMLESGAQK